MESPHLGGEVTSGDYHDGQEVEVCPHGWRGFVELGLVRALLSIWKTFMIIRQRVWIVSYIRRKLGRYNG